MVSNYQRDFPCLLVVVFVGFFWGVLFNIPQIIQFVCLFTCFDCLFVPLVGPSSYTLHTAQV